MKIGLYFGSFNPIHIGHAHIAQQAQIQQHLDLVWLVVSPQNPFKQNDALAPEHHRLAMAQLAFATNDTLRVSDIEFSLPRPSYSIVTLREFIRQQPNANYFLIVGEDNLNSFQYWKDFDLLLELAELLVYPRSNEAVTVPDALSRFASRIHILNGAILPVSATHIRDAIRHSLPINGLVAPEVKEYIENNNLYC
jgi:nicotinate-nucleotide adenylyltransferase